MWGHWDGHGDIRVDMGTLRWMWEQQDGHGAIGMDTGTSGRMWGHWDGHGDIGMDMGTWGRMWGHGDGGRCSGTDGRGAGRQGATLQPDAARDDAVPLRRAHGHVGGRRQVEQQQRRGDAGRIAALLSQQGLALLEGRRQRQAVLRTTGGGSRVTP